MFANIGTTELLVLLFLFVVLFGGSKVTDVAKGLGEAVKEFKRAQKEFDTVKDELDKEPLPVAPVVEEPKPSPEPKSKPQKTKKAKPKSLKK